jgi:GH24 family phage-related lysozyme (muramidase)
MGSAMSGKLPAGFKVIDTPKLTSPMISRDTELETFLKSGFQGAMAEFGDEAMAALMTPYTMASGLSDKGIVDTYKNLRDDAREVQKASEAKNTKSAIAGKLTGAVTSGILAAPLTPITSLKGALGVGAGMGGLYGLGESEASLTEQPLEVLQDVGTGAAMGGAGGAVGYGIGKVVTSPNMQALLRDESGAVGRKIGGALSPAERTVFRALVEEKGFSPQQAAEYIRNAGRGDIPLTLPEATESKTLLGYEKLFRGGASGKASEVEGAFTGNRRGTVGQAFEGDVGSIVAPVKSPDIAGKGIKSAAQSVLSRAETKRFELAKPFYQLAYQQSVPDEAAYSLLENPLISDAYSKISKDPVWQSELSKQVKGSLGEWDVTKRYLDNLYNKAITTGAKPEARIIDEARKQITSKMDEVSPAYNQARTTFAKASPKVEKLRNSIVGVMADLGDGDVVKAADKLFQASPAQIKYTRRMIQTASPQAWDDLIASYIGQVGDKANHSPAKILNALSNLGESGSVLRDKKLVAALGEDKAKAMGKLFSTMKKTTLVRGGSDTAFNLQSQAGLNADLMSPLEMAALQGQAGGMDKAALIRRSGEWVRNQIMAKRYEELAKIFVGDGSEEFAKKIEKLPANSLETWRLVNDRISKIGTSGARGFSQPVTTQERPTEIIINPAAKGTQGVPDVQLPTGFKVIEPSDATLPAVIPDTQPQASFTQQNEGLRLSAYMDTTGNPTIGYGNNLKSPVTKRAWKEAGIQTPYADAYRGRAAITPDEALRLNQASEQITRKDAEAVYGRLSRYTPNQQIALADMSYQLGLPALKGFKNFNAAMKKGDTFSAVNHLIKSKLATQTPERVKRKTPSWRIVLFLTLTSLPQLSRQMVIAQLFRGLVAMAILPHKELLAVV